MNKKKMLLIILAIVMTVVVVGAILGATLSRKSCSNNGGTDQGGDTENEPEKIFGSEGLEYTLSDDGTYYYFSGLGTCTDTEIVIGNYYNDKPVKQIGKYVATYEELMEIVSDLSENEIETLYIFSCSNVISITISEGVEAIGAFSFGSIDEDSYIENISVPDSVTVISYGAFAGCSRLKNITIPDSVTSIGMDAFGGTAFYNDKSYWENDVLYIGKHLISADYILDTLDIYEIKSGTLTIAGAAFRQCYNLTSIIMPDSVTSIGEAAFLDCCYLTSIIMPNSVMSIGEEAFFECSSLTDISFKGTKEQWEAIEKGRSWDKDTGDYTIHCTDGDIIKQQ